MHQNVIIFNNYFSHYHFSGITEGFFPLSWLSEDEIPLSTNCPEMAVLNLVALVIADRKESGPKVTEMLRTTLQFIFFDPKNPISVWKNKQFPSSQYKEHDEVKVYIEGTFGKIEFQLRFQNKLWQIHDVKEVTHNG
jgi:hypothetical protein